MDRLCTAEDIDYFKDLTQELVNAKFKESWKKEEIFDNNMNQPKVLFSMILFSDNPEKSYSLVNDWS